MCKVKLIVFSKTTSKNSVAISLYNMYSAPKSEGTVHTFSNNWALHFTERRHSIETHDITLVDVL